MLLPWRVSKLDQSSVCDAAERSTERPDQFLLRHCIKTIKEDQRTFRGNAYLSQNGCATLNPRNRSVVWKSIGREARIHDAERDKRQ